ncbi:MAG TPA: hypothetical protein PKC30_02805 [Saprospiraceae bacterium]|nr:hypothetical protein [Saprospiraceae bacterium]
MRNTSWAAIISLGGVILAGSSFFYYYLGYRMMEEMLEDASAHDALYSTMNLVWILTTISLFLCGVWAIFIGITIRKNLRYMKKQALTLGGGLLTFGIIGFLHTFPNWKLFIFIVVGCLIFIPGLFLSKQKGPYY